jgi:2-haloacid dehalogenase
MAEGTAVLKKAYPEYGELIDLFYDRWDEMLNGEIPDSAAILSELKKSYKLFALTNWSAETFHIALERFPFLQMFEGIVVSGVEKMLKPDKRLFKALLDRFALKAEQCVYVDDTKRNVEVANELGFHAIHFISAADFKRKMESLNLLK